MGNGANWIEANGALERTFELPSFREAIAFVGRVADLAEEANHHPDIAIDVAVDTHSSAPV